MSDTSFHFEMPQKVLFKHCDPAGIVFYPRYFEMMNDCVEAFFDAALGWPFETMHRDGFGVPTAQIETRFQAPSRHGDLLALGLNITRLGGSSLSYEMIAHSGDEVRFTTFSTLVNVNEKGRPTGWPDRIRTRLKDLMRDAP